VRSSYVLGLCLSTCLTSPAAAEDWYQIATSDSSIDYADADSVRTYGNIMSVDVLRGLGDGGGLSGYLKIAVDVSCANNQFRLTRAVSYDTQRQYLSTDETATGWETIAANSIAEQVRRFACDKGLHDTFVADPFGDAEDYWYYYGG